MSTRATHNLITPDIVEHALPGTTAQERDIAFRQVIEDLGSYEAAEQFYEECVTDDETLPVLGDSLPPADRDLESQDFGHLKLFYHTFLPDLPQWKDDVELYSFYIGLRGKGPQSIMPDLKESGIVVKVAGFTGKWQETSFLAVQPGAKVRVSYTNPRSGGEEMHEIIFPPPRNEAHIPVLRLGYPKSTQLQRGAAF